MSGLHRESHIRLEYLSNIVYFLELRFASNICFVAKAAIIRNNQVFFRLLFNESLDWTLIGSCLALVLVSAGASNDLQRCNIKHSIAVVGFLVLALPVSTSFNI